MCGICCYISKFCQPGNCSPNESLGLPTDDYVYNYVKPILNNRGGDELGGRMSDGCIGFEASVLWQQGSGPTTQPQVCDDFVLLFNGDLFMEREDREKSDTCFLYHTLMDNSDNECAFLDTFKSLRGPYSIIIWHKKFQKVYFARDPLGRNSLLIGMDNSGLVYLTSVIVKHRDHKVMEIPPLGIYSIDMNCSNFSIKLNPWENQSYHRHSHYLEEFEKLQEFLGVKIELRYNITPDWMHRTCSPSYNFRYDFLEEIKRANLTSDTPEIFERLLENSEIERSSNTLLKLLENSVKDRIANTPNFCKNCITCRDKRIKGCAHSKIGILFSGGIDCSILCVLADKFVDKKIPIDLLNVAFEKVNHDPKKKTAEIDWNVPDRITAKETLKELEKICPDRVWNLVEINVDRKELNEILVEKIVNLVHPLVSILDESLGGALWFAARGSGQVNEEPYQCPARVLLIGSGADELFGGYTRHRNAYQRGGPQLLDDELELDWVRLPSRNLGRDDRIIGDHGITARAPYVEEEVVRFVRNLRSLQKCCHNLEPGVGDKLLLRLCGFKLGLKNCCQFKKRALQFGSRIADRKQNAKQTSRCFQNEVLE